MMSKKRSNRRARSAARYIMIAIAIILFFLLALTAASFSSVLLRRAMFSDQQASVIADMVGGVVAAIAAGLVIIEIRAADEEHVRQNDIEESSFILQYNQAFIQDPNMTEVESLLERNAFYGLPSPIMNSDNRQQFINYLVYLEGLAPLILNGILKLEHIDNLMAYRFFLAVNNPELQKSEIEPFAIFYQGCFKLYKRWSEYRLEHHLEIPLRKSSLDKLEVFALMQQDFSEEKLLARQLKPNSVLTPQQLKQVATLIYDTDPFIYPALFSGEGDPSQLGQAILADLLEKNTDAMFRKDNIFALYANDIIIAAILWNEGELSWDRSALMESAKTQGIRLDESKVAVVEHDYFAQYNEPSEHISVINLCVNHYLRGSGIGEYLLRAFLSQHHKQPVELFVLADNKDAIRLYEKNGFEIVEETTGFSLDTQKPACYKMIRPAQ